MSIKKRLFWVTLFSIAMGFFEASVVIYLRRLYYQHGFSFPLQPIPNDIAIVEIWREAATIIMLLSVGVLVGKATAERFAWFIFTFAVWDIFYYIFLFIVISWPQSFFTWDILFLIPVPWVGPVITPVIIALTMILFGLTIIYISGKGRNAALSARESVLIIAGSLVTIYAFIKDYLQQNGDILYRNIRQGGSLFTDLANYVPLYFDWIAFIIGESLILLAWGFYVNKVRRYKVL